MQLLCRSRQDHVVQAWSADNGATWGPLSFTSLPNPNSGTDAVTLKNGLQALVYNPLPRGKNWSSGRAKLFLAVSKNGVDWAPIFTFENGATGEYSYPAIIQDEQGRIHVTYTAERKNIRHVVMRVVESKTEEKVKAQ
jgi:alpha-L-fucosidase